MSNYRQLTDKEIATLNVYGCSAENWKNVMVSENFSPRFITNVHFSGNIFLGTYEKVFEKEGGIKKHSGIYNSVLHNCTIGNDVFIDKINNYIANYHIEDGAYIENVNLLVVDRLSSFGNGVKVAVMIENGAREISMFDKLTSQFAYFSVFYRQQNELTSVFEIIVEKYSQLQLSETGIIGKNAQIVNCCQLKNVRVGDFANLEGVSQLENGTIISNEKAPVYIGAGVQCTDFIIQSGSSVTEAALISRCFVGQGCVIGKQFSAIDSLLFANFQGLHGEAVSIFAGPYTITHHKSTLMLTALYSFMNAGSGTNFSNHMYKLGPVHQGITERGVKTSSNSYIMWPARIGAFSVVLGRHKGNPDFTDLPFSYLMENDSESVLLPAINLHSAGTMRDVQKWPKRDMRKDDLKSDLICFDFLSPYTISKSLNGIQILKNLLQTMDESASFVWYQNCKIKKSAIKKGIELYEMAVSQFIGNAIVAKLDGEKIDSRQDIENCLSTKDEIGIGKWVDLAGLFAPKSAVDKLIGYIVSEEMNIEAIQSELNKMFQYYSDYSWNFAVDLLGKTELENIISALENCKKAEITFTDLILRDAKKEFSQIAKTGFGIDGDENDKNADFEAVRGDFNSNLFVVEIQKSSEIKLEKLNNIIEILKKIN
jgi:carbonic anhydrase/acetyltransferase-like protein (isoleucine patch superfamily)